MEKIYLTHLYPKSLSIYGDKGNMLILQKRFDFFGFDVVIQNLEIGQDLPARNDFYFIGGGQDTQQSQIATDILRFSPKLISDVSHNTPLLAICGGYQLLGKEFITGNGEIIKGISLFDIATTAPTDSVKDRCVGNLVIKCQIRDLKNITLVGFENHSGQTKILSDQSKPLGQVILGHGNSRNGGDEGAIYKNAIGTYMHGPCLSKNPELADYLVRKIIRTAAENKLIDPKSYLEFDKKPLFDDKNAILAKEILISRLK
jgi:lipid II isoglutaminyl synthase (glutamine-hydrolysing)